MDKDGHITAKDKLTQDLLFEVKFVLYNLCTASLHNFKMLFTLSLTKEFLVTVNLVGSVEEKI